MTSIADIARQGSVRDVTLALIQHPDGDVRVWDGIGILEHDGEQWLGTGLLGSISVAGETTETLVSDLVFGLSGVDANLAALADSSVKGLMAWVWKGFCDENMRVVATLQIAEAVLDRLEIAVDENGQASVKLTARSGFYFLETQSTAVWDPQHQRAMLEALGEDPDSDTGFDLMHEMKNTQVAWRPD